VSYPHASRSHTRYAEPMKVAVTGSSGLIGKALIELLEASEHEVIRIIRDQSKLDSNTRYWNPATGDIDTTAFDEADAVVHLAGANIGERRWSDNRKRELRESRVTATELLVEAMHAVHNPPAVLVAGSAVGYYGNRGDEVLSEDSEPGKGFLADLTVDWEAATNTAEHEGTRVVLARTGLVVSGNAPFLTKMLKPFKLGLGGPLGDGTQWWSWIDIEDEVRALAFLLTSNLSGPINLCSPNPVTNREFTRTLASVLKRPALLPVPRFGPRLLLGAELADELLFCSTKAMPNVLCNAGFEFEHDNLQATLQRALVSA